MSEFAKEAQVEYSDDPSVASSLADKMQFIIDDVVANAGALSTHRYGCRVVQRAVEHCMDPQKNAVLDEIIACHEKLVSDQYGKKDDLAFTYCQQQHSSHSSHTYIFHSSGNYVIQQVMLCGSDDHQEAIIKTLTKKDSLLALSKHKYASNVVEAVLVHGKPQHKERIVEEMLKVRTPLFSELIRTLHCSPAYATAFIALFHRTQGTR